MKSLITLFFFVGLVVGVVSATTALIPRSPFLAGIAILEFGVLLYGLFWRLSRQIVYQCAQCDRYFALSAISNIMAINAIDFRLVRCPACGKTEYDRSFPRNEVQADIIELGQIQPPRGENWKGFYIQLTVTSLFYIGFVVLFIFYWNTAKGILNLGEQTLLNIQRDLLVKFSAISATFALYLSVFISAIKERYKNGIFTAMSVILTVLIVIILLIEYSHLKYFLKITENLAAF